MMSQDFYDNETKRSSESSIPALVPSVFGAPEQSPPNASTNGDGNISGNGNGNGNEGGKPAFSQDDWEADKGSLSGSAKPNPTNPTDKPPVDPSDPHNVLALLDTQKISWYHVKMVVIAGMGFFCDSYDLFSISLVTNTIGRIYYPNLSYYSPTYCSSQYPHPITGCGANFNKIYGLFPEVQGVLMSPTGADISNGATVNGMSYFDYQALMNRHVPSAIPSDVDSALKGVALCGTFAGQLLFGWLGDRLGRKRTFGYTLWIMVVSALLQMFSIGHGRIAVITSLCLFRFVLGLGVGGDYPLSATLMSEYSSKSNRGVFIAAVFAMQGVGYLTAAVVGLIVSAAFDSNPTGTDPDYIWRIVLAFGAVPTAMTMKARMGMPETPRYTLFVERNQQKMRAEMERVLTRDTGKPLSMQREAEIERVVGIPREYEPYHPAVKVNDWTWSEFLKKFGLGLFGASVCWFLLDIAFYSQNLFQSDVFTAAGWLPANYTMTITNEAYKTARAQAIVALCSTIPGYWFTVATIEKLGRWKIQFGGFFFMTLFMAILAGDYTNLKSDHTAAFVALYALTFFFANWGPNSTTFVVPAEIFPAKYRSTGHGIAAASGKAGAIIGTFGFGNAQGPWGLRTVLGVLAGVNVFGLFFTFLLVPETKNKSLEELNDDRVIASQSRSTSESQSVSSKAEQKV